MTETSAVRRASEVLLKSKNLRVVSQQPHFMHFLAFTLISSPHTVHAFVPLLHMYSLGAVP